MKKLTFLLLISVATVSVPYANVLRKIDFSQNERRVVLELSVENLDVSVVRYSTLDNPPRLYVDIENVSQRELSNFTRRFDSENMLVTGLRLWHHDSLGRKRNVARLVMDYNEDMLKEYKIIRDQENKVFVLLYPKDGVSLVSFNWNSGLLPAVAQQSTRSVARQGVPKQDAKKIDGEGGVVSVKKGQEVAEAGLMHYIEDISIKGYGISEDIVVKFDGDLPQFRVNKISDRVFLIEFDNAVNLKNKGMQRFFEKDFGFFEKVKFFEKDVERDEKSVIKVTTLKPIAETNGTVVYSRDNKVVISSPSFSDIAYYSYSLSSQTHLPFKGNKKASAASFFRELIPKIVTPALAQVISDSSRYIRVVGQSVDIRLGPGEGYGVIGVLATGDVVETFGGRLGYYKIRHNNRDAWVMANLVSPLKQGSPPPMEIVSGQLDAGSQGGVLASDGFEEFSARSRYRVNAKSLNLRSGSNRADPIVRVLQNNEELIVEGRRNNWYRVVLASDTTISGWAFGDFIVPIAVGQQGELQQQGTLEQTADTGVVDILAEREKVTFRSTQLLDPFVPRVRSTSVESGPDVEDLVLVGIIYDAYDRIALLESQDEDLAKTIFTMREGDRVRNGRLHKIYEDRVVFLLTVFGVTRTHILKMEPKKAN